MRLWSPSFSPPLARIRAWHQIWRAKSMFSNARNFIIRNGSFINNAQGSGLNGKSIIVIVLKRIKPNLLHFRIGDFATTRVS